jgi:sugar phosphate isomerase/epimerase
MDRRQALKTLAGAAAAQVAQAAPQASPQAAPAPDGQAARSATPPQVIVFSQNLVQIGYPELGDIVHQLGFDGVDLSVLPGGHVEPRIANVDEVRAFEVMEGAGLSVPVITTVVTSPMDRTALPVIAFAGMSHVPLFRPGTWPYNNAPNIMQRIGEVQRDLAGLLAFGRQYGTAAAFHNPAGDNVGAAVWDIQRILEPFDANLAGFYFDICNATAEGGAGGWEIALRLALPRLKAVTIQDFIWEKQNEHWQMTKCPLGQGMVDWPKFFKLLAQANYAGPVTLEIGYPVRDMPSALTRDLQFARKQLQTAWGAGAKT